MAKIRVHELAKERGMPSKEVLVRLQAAGVDAKAAASSVDSEVAKAALDGKKLEGGKLPVAKAEPVKPSTNASPKPSGSGSGAPSTSGTSGKRRRVVIDSQASRRPSGPGPGLSNAAQARRGRGRRRRTPFEEPVTVEQPLLPVEEPPVKINSGSTVKAVAEALGVPAAEAIKQLMLLGEMATLTQSLSDEATLVLAEALDKKAIITTTADEVVAAPSSVSDDSDAELAARPPVVTIMGHVDHGKTSLLDAIRETEVAVGEAGGITQHIGAYQVHHGSDLITFLDTPGHQAFTAMRARGASVTDIVVIVVAADDGVMPQTEEAIDHAKAAGVPIVVAVNKIDKEGADPTRVRTELAGHGLQPEEWGGDTVFVDVSAKTGENLDQLLDMLALVAEVQELRGNPTADAVGTVVESRLDPGRGPVVTMLVQRGELKIGDVLVAGAQPGRIRAMTDYKGTRVEVAPLGMPVEILGFDGVPEAGDIGRVVPTERIARQQAGNWANRLKTEGIARRAGVKVSLEDAFARAQAGTLKSLSLLIKADVAGSLEALEDEIAKLPQSEITVGVVHTGVGGINESDVMLASASQAVVIGFNVRPVGESAQLAAREGVEIRTYTVIYKVIDELHSAMEGMLEPEEVEDALGTAEVRQIFKASRIGSIAGCQLTVGTAVRGAKARLVRDGTVIYDGSIGSLRRFNDDVKEVTIGMECGIVLQDYSDVKEGDVIEIYETRSVDRQLA